LHRRNIDLISTLSRDWLDYARQLPEIAAIGWEGTLSVPLITLDALIATHGAPDFCKIDVEGYELEVLKGLGQPIPLVSVEYMHGRPQPTLDCISRLTELGDYVFNLSELESMEMSCDEWVSADEVSAMLVERFGKQEFGYGDVYARSSTRPAKNSLNWR
jgi:hypothetical protein